MLTRLKVSGFKNLVDVDVRFGPFTCIAGGNGVGKSNLFDAIAFLSGLADKTFVEAALSVRDENGRSGDVRNLFYRVGANQHPEMTFEVEMIVPQVGIDALGQEAHATTTFLTYKLRLRDRRDDSSRALGEMELVEEELSYVKRSEASRHLGFKHSKTLWRDAVVIGARRGPSFISTETTDSGRTIKVHQDGGSSGKPRTLRARDLPRTALSVATASESPTATLARLEMQSWRMLQLEPSALRAPDKLREGGMLSANGAHLPATLYHLANLSKDPWAVYGALAQRLAELIDDVASVDVDRDETRELFTLRLTSFDGTSLPARALSDGTLRFLALTVIELTPASGGLVCLEEPENGISPQRLQAMLRLLRDIAVDPEREAGLRQVIINTHSPQVVAEVPEEDLLVAEVREMNGPLGKAKGAMFSCLSNTWRAKLGGPVLALGQLVPYLSLFGKPPEPDSPRRVMDREDVQMLLPFSA